MANLNKVMIIGNLTRDPEVRKTPKGTAVSEISLAVNRQAGGKDGTERREETTYIEVTLWGRQAELAGQYLSKGRPVYIEGRLTVDSWEDKQSGQKRTKLKVVGDSMQFLGSGGSQGGGRHNEGQSRQTNQGNARPSGNYRRQEEDDIPF